MKPASQRRSCGWIKTLPHFTSKQQFIALIVPDQEKFQAGTLRPIPADHKLTLWLQRKFSPGSASVAGFINRIVPLSDNPFHVMLPRRVWNSAIKKEFDIGYDFPRDKVRSGFTVGHETLKRPCQTRRELGCQLLPQQGDQPGKTANFEMGDVLFKQLGGNRLSNGKLTVSPLTLYPRSIHFDHFNPNLRKDQLSMSPSN